MAVKALINTFLILPFFIFMVLADPNIESMPSFAFSWLDYQDTYISGDTATIKVKILGNFDPHSYKFGFNPNISVNEKTGNSTFISGLSLNFGGDQSSWTITFVPILVGVFNVLITDDHFAVLDSSLHFFVNAGKMHPGASIASWADYVNEFKAGSRAMVLILPKDAFGNNIPSTNAELNSYVFSVSQSYENKSATNVLSVTSLGWNNNGHIRLDFIASLAGNLLLHVRRGSHTLRGSPLPFKVHPGPVEVSKCIAVWKYGTSVSQLSSKVEIFIHQLDLYGNIVPRSYSFDAEISDKHTHLSIPVADLNFKNISPGLQQLEFGAMEPGSFLLIIFDANNNKTISNMPLEFTVSIGYCDGINSIINGSGLNQSIVGQESRFTVYLRDEYQYPSPVNVRMLRVQIVKESGSYEVSPIIYPLEKQNGIKSPWHIGTYDSMRPFEVDPVPSVNQTNAFVGTSQVLSDAYGVIFTPQKSGFYDIDVLCGNIPLNKGHSFKKAVKAGETNVSLSRVMRYEPKTKKLTKSDIIVQLLDSFSNSVLSQQSKLKLEIGSINHSEYKIWEFVDNKDGTYTAQYLMNDVGSYELCVSFDIIRILPCPFGVNVYNNEYFPKANDDSIWVLEDESVSFNPLSNDYYAGQNPSIIQLSNPFHGTVLKKGLLLRYTPFKDFYGNDSFSYTARDANGNTATSFVNITVLSIPPKIISFLSNLRASEDLVSPKFGTFRGIEILYPDIVESIHVIIGANSGTISLSPVIMQFWQPIWSEFAVNRHGREAKALNLSGPVEVLNMVLQSIQYSGDENFYGSDTIAVTAMNRNGANDLNVPIFVEPVNDSPLILVPEYIILEEKDEVNGSLIFEEGRNKNEFLIVDPDLHHFPGNKSDFVVSLSMEVTSGILEAILPVTLANTSELKLVNSYQWQPLQTFVSISQHFVLKARGLRFHGTIDECNYIVKQSKYYAEEYGAVLLITINDMGNYGCFPDCTENMSKPLLSQASVNLIKRKSPSRRAGYALGFMIILEFLLVLPLGLLLLFYTCKCAISLIGERRNSDSKNDSEHGAPTSGRQIVSPT